MTELELHEHEGDAHPHDHDHDHGHEHEADLYGPQPIPMQTACALVPMMDGTDRVMVTFRSGNGSWVAFFDRDGAVAHAKTLLALAFQPGSSEPVDPAADG